MYKTDTLNPDDPIYKFQKETLTPYKIIIIILIKSYCLTTRKTTSERRDFCITILKLIQTPVMEFSSLLQMLHSPKLFLQRFAQELETECKLMCETGIEGLLELFDVLMRLMKSSVDHTLVSHLLCRNSVLGLYVRRIIVFFEQLSFSQVSQLYDDCVKEFEKVDIKNNSNGSEIVLKKNNKVAWDGRQAELLVAQQASALQSNEHIAMSPLELQTLIQNLLNSNNYYAEAHYLGYLNYLRINDYCGALESLYHCFDRLAPLENRNGTDDRSRTFRYAALNLAALHAQFNHKKVAQAALKEAIMMAQEAGDNTCLQLAHAWMYYLSDKTKGHLIQRSVAKASILGITHTMSLGLIALAHNLALEGKTPANIFEILMKSDILNCQHSLSDLISMTFSQKAALWVYYGKARMSTASSQLLLLHNSGNNKKDLFNGESTCQSVINVANAMTEIGEYKLVDVVLNHAKERFPNEPCNKIWILSKQLYEFSKLMKHEKWNDAENIAFQIGSINSLESKFRLIEVALAKGNFINGLEYLNEIERNETLSPPNKVKAMILSSQIMISSTIIENGVVISGTNPLVLLNLALAVATKNYLSYYEALVKIHLANIQLILGMPNKALSLIKEAIVEILGSGSLYDQGRALVLYAKCLIAASPSTSKNRKGIIKNSIKSLINAKEYFKKIEAVGKIKSTVYLLSILYNELDLKNERNQSAFEFRQINEQLSYKLNYQYCINF